MKLATIKNLKPGGFRHRIANPSGAIDLASIMVGVLVIGVVGSVIAATVMAVIPWSQDQSAKGNLDAVATAESTSIALHGEAVAYDSHTDSEYRAFEGGEIGLERPGTRLVIETSGTSWVAAQESATGNIFIRTSASPEVYEAEEAGYLIAAAAGVGFGPVGLSVPLELKSSLPAGITDDTVQEVIDVISGGSAWTFKGVEKRGFGAPVVAPEPEPEPELEVPSNTTTIALTCLQAEPDFYSYAPCTAADTPMGTALNVDCRATRAGIWFFHIDSGTHADMFVRALDTDRLSASMPGC